MPPRTFKIIDGPNKPTLQRALMLPDELTAHFEIEGDALDATITWMEEQADGFSFKLQGRVASGTLKGAQFKAIYHIEGRSGSIAVESAAAA